MKKIEAIVRSEAVTNVRHALNAVDFSGMTITQVDGHGNQKGTVQRLQGREYKVGVLPKTKIEIIAKDKDVESIVQAIRAACKSGQIGDGKIFISNIEEVIRVRTGETGDKAL